jgi:DNA-binding XRE family transcriptional regulator
MSRRLELRISQQKLADTLGVTRKTISSWENGHSEPNLTIKQFKALLKVLRYTSDELPETFGPQPIHSSSPFYGKRATDSSN